MAIEHQDLLNLAQRLLDDKRRDSTYRRFTALDRTIDEHVAYPYFVDSSGHALLHMCLSDYLALSQNKAAIKVAATVLERDGLSSSGSRNIGGTRSIHGELEQLLADWHSAEDCLLYPTGNAANADAIAVLSAVSPYVKMFSDADNHSSLIEGMRGLEAGKRKFIFRHNDVEHLQHLFHCNVLPRDIPILVVESLYSMSGDFAPLADLVPWFKEKGGIVVVNEVHAVGVLGKEGAGGASQSGVGKDVDITIGSLSKAIGGFGGYVAGRAILIDLLRQTGVRSIFTTSMPAYVCAAAVVNIRCRRGSDERVIELRRIVEVLREGLASRGVRCDRQGSHIVPVIVGDEKVCGVVAEELYHDGYYVVPIRYPTVPKGEARLRICVNPRHSAADIDAFCERLRDALASASPAAIDK